MVFCRHVQIRDEKFGSVIFDTLREKVFVTNETGREILCLLEERQSLDKTVDVLANTYGLKSVQIRDDVVSFINHLKDNGIVT